MAAAFTSDLHVSLNYKRRLIKKTQVIIYCIQVTRWHPGQSCRIKNSAIQFHLLVTVHTLKIGLRAASDFCDIFSHGDHTGQDCSSAAGSSGDDLVSARAGGSV